MLLQLPDGHARATVQLHSGRHARVGKCLGFEGVIQRLSSLQVICQLFLQSSDTRGGMSQHSQRCITMMKQPGTTCQPFCTLQFHTLHTRLHY